MWRRPCDVTIGRGCRCKNQLHPGLAFRPGGFWNAERVVKNQRKRVCENCHACWRSYKPAATHCADETQQNPAQGQVLKPLVQARSKLLFCEMIASILFYFFNLQVSSVPRSLQMMCLLSPHLASQSVSQPRIHLDSIFGLHT